MMFLRIMGYVWATPVALLALLLAPFYGPVSVKWKDGALDVEVKRMYFKWITAQTWGWVIFYRHKPGKAAPITWPMLREHERVHVRQCMILGPLVFVLYPLGSLVAWAIGGHYYRDNWMELQAFKLQGRVRKSTAVKKLP